MKGVRTLTVLAVLAAAVCCLARLGALPLIQPDEGRNAEVAREMEARGEWIVPTYDGLPYLDKPAFYFRLVGISMAALGENETAARLPGALAALGVLALVYAFARRSYGARAAALAVLVVGTTPLVVAFARIVIFDMVLALFVTAAVLAGYVAEEKDGAARMRWYLLGAACAGTGTLVKGPVGFLLPALVLAGFHLLNRTPAAIKRLFAPLNLLVFFAIVLPWFFAVAHRRPDFPYYGLVEESLHRFTSSQFHRSAPFWYYVPVIAGVFFPWSILLPESVASAWRVRTRWARADRLLIAWVLVAVVFFSISQSKLPGYVLTAVVALGVLVARVLDLAFEAPGGRAGRLVVRGTIGLALIAALGAGLLAAAHATQGGLPALLHVRGGDVQRLGPATGALFWTFAILALAAAVAAWRRDARLVSAAFALPPLLLLTIAFGGARTYAEASSARQLARTLPALPPATDVACLQCLPNGLPFYLRRTVTVVTRDGSETTSNYVVFFLKRTSPWPDQVVPVASLGAWLAARRAPVFLLADANGRSRLDSIAVPRALSVTQLTDGWWGALLPPPGDH
ncbi:MAG TPA: glycosyltransferase family 39 protein [Gemmatimonadales bacterium]|nr:glycosyltransferase family 39 protein [Gemmatimonadales bacterium]